MFPIAHAESWELADFLTDSWETLRKLLAEMAKLCLSIV